MKSNKSLSSVTHTPGPWAVHPMCARIVPESHISREICYDEDGKYDVEKHAHEICLLRWPDEHRSEHEVMENAFLIAAAPDLLASLRDVLPYLESVGPLPEFERARAAIAKATGE